MKVYLITSAKYEELYIEDWVNYHLLHGVDKIIINDNNPENYPYKLTDILKKYIDEGSVIIERYYNTLCDYSKECIDSDGCLGYIYNWMYYKYIDEFDWAIKIDVDEYLIIPETNNNIKKFLSQDKFKTYDAICLNWIMYSDDTQYYKPMPVYKRCNITYDESYDMWYKCIVKSTGNMCMTHHISINWEEDNNRICLANGLSVQEALDKHIIKTFIDENGYDWGVSSININLFKSLKYCVCAYLAHFRNLSFEEQQIKDYKFWRNDGKNIKDLYKIYLSAKNKQKRKMTVEEIDKIIKSRLFFP